MSAILAFFLAVILPSGEQCGLSVGCLTQWYFKVNDDDQELFRQQMIGVQKLKNANNSDRKPPGVTPGQLYSRKTAETQTSDENPLSTEFVDPVDPLDILSFKRDGIQQGVFRRLKQGRYAIDATLDLHRLSIEEARQAVYQFIRDCAEMDVRTALISHGKGIRSVGRPAVLKSYVAKWLPIMPDVMAFHSAQSFHGGVGCVYILLRKSKNQKEINRRRFGFSK